MMKKDRTDVVLDRLMAILDATNGYGFDTYDTRVGALYQGLYRRRANSRLADLAMRGLYAAEVIAPITYRRLRGIRPTWDPMGNSYRANVHCLLALVEDREAHLAKARDILDQVATKAVGEPGRRGFALGFLCITGSDKLWSTNVPVAHYTLRVARAFMRYERVAGDLRYRAILTECVEFLAEGLPWREEGGLMGVGYTPADPLHVINIWADVASVLASYGRLAGTSRFEPQARGLAESVLAHFRADATWPYFSRWEKNPGPVDNSHTAMVLGALADIVLCRVGDESLRSRIVATLGQAVPKWLELFFDEETGRSWNLIDRPNDAFTVTVGDTAYALVRLIRPELGLPQKLVARLERLEDRNVRWACGHLQLRNGRFCERRLGRWRFSVQSIRSFDGLVAEAMALHHAAMRGVDCNQLWSA